MFIAVVPLHTRNCHPSICHPQTGSLLLSYKGVIKFQDSILRVSFLSLVWIPQKGYEYFNGEVIPRSRSRDSGNGIGQEENPMKEFATKIITIVFS